MSNVLDKHVGAYEGNSPYEFDNSILLHWYPKRIVDLSPGTESLLELGLGHGYSTPLFSRRLARHVVVEGSPAVIANFRKKSPDCRAEIVESFFEDYSTDERFDVIVMGFVLEHVEDSTRVLRHFRQFLAPAGTLYIAVPNAESMNRRLGHLAGILPDMQTLSSYDRELGHRRLYTVDKLKSEIADAGYSLERLEGIYLKPMTTAQLMSLQLSSSIIDALCTLGMDYPELCCGLLARAKASP